MVMPAPITFTKSSVQEATCVFERVSMPAQIKDEWLALQRKTGTAFQTYEWFTAWMETVGRASRKDPAIIVCRALDGTLVAIWPLVLSRQNGISVLTTPGRLHAAYHRPLVADGYAVPCFFGTGSNSAFALFRDVDTISLDGLRLDDNADLTAIGNLTRAGVGYGTHQLTLSDSWQALYESKFSSKSRSTHRRKLRQLERLGPVRFEIADNLEGKLEMLGTILEQKRADLHAKGKPDPCELPGARAFYEYLASMIAEEQIPEVVVAGMRVGNELAAGHIGIIHRDTFHSLILSLGFSEARRYSPGQALTFQLIDFCCQRGLKVIDFGAGDQNYKRELADSAFHLMHCTSWLTVKGFAKAKAEILQHHIKSLALQMFRRN